MISRIILFLLNQINYQSFSHCQISGRNLVPSGTSWPFTHLAIVTHCVNRPAVGRHGNIIDAFVSVDTWHLEVLLGGQVAHHERVVVRDAGHAAAISSEAYANDEILMVAMLML